MVVATYLFEARQIQSYVFATSKLRDATGASELVNAIASDDDDGGQPIGLAPDLWVALGLNPTVHRATGGVIEISCGADDVDRLVRFRAALRLTLASEVPGLAWSDGIGRGGTIAESRAAARVGARAGQVQSELWPLINPLVRPAPRSGGVPSAAKGLTTKAGLCLKTGEFADLPTLKKRDAADRRALANKFLPADQAKGYHWPVEFPQAGEEVADVTTIFPFKRGVLRRVALIHADGNGMGKLFQEAVKRLADSGKGPDEVRKLSQAIARATRQAVQEAMGAVVLPAASAEKVLPCRPILLGGDDLTLILRADLALPFAHRYLAVFERHSQAQLAPFGFEAGLTAKLGLVFLGPNQPFGSAHQLCESLASSARDAQTSRVAFWRLTSSVIPQDVEELTGLSHVSATGVQLRRASHDLESLAKLQRLAALLEHDDVGSGALRRVPELLRHDLAAAERTFEDALKALKRKSAGVRNGVSVYDQVLAALADLGLGPKSPLGSDSYTPLWEAHELSQIARLKAGDAERQADDEGELA